jgi:transcriptional regulator with XRE-family HTH domain
MEFKDLNNVEKASQKRDFAKIIGLRIRDVRKQQGFTQEKLAEAAGYDSAYIGHIETGRYSPSVYTVWRMAKAMGVDLGDMLKGL